MFAQSDAEVKFKVVLDDDSAQKNINNLSKSTDKLASKFTSAGKALTIGLTTPIAGLVTVGAKYNATVEQLNTSFEVMTGSAEKAAEITQELKDIGSKTPYEFTGLAEVTQLLMQYGLTADDAIDSMEMLGDISQGSSEKMNSIALAFGQMSSYGKVTLVDIKQMITAGFNPLQEISESTGESMESLYDRISDGTLAVDEITASMKRSTSQGGKYFKSMEKQSKTLSGQISTLKDEFSNATGELTKAMIPALKSVVQWVTKLAQWFSSLSDEQKKTILVIAGVVAAIGPVILIIAKLVTAIGTIKTAINGVKVAMAALSSNPYTLAITAIVAACALAVTGITALIDAMDKSKEAAENASKGIENWKTGLSNAESHLSEFDDTLFASSSKIEELEANMQEVQEGITAITQTASQERRNLTEQEIQKIDEYFKKLRALNDEELAIQESKAKAIMIQAENIAKSHDLSLEEYQTYAQEWIKTATEQKDAQISIINEQTTTEIALLNQKYGDKATLENEAYKKEYDAIMSRKNEKIAQVTDEVGKIYALYTEGYLERAGLDDKLNAHIKGNLAERETLQETHQQKMAEILENENLTKEEKNKKASELDKKYQEDLKKVNDAINLGYKNFVESLSEEEQEQLGVLMSMSANTELYGGKMDEKTIKFVNSMINTYSTMPSKTKGVMKDALSPMLTEMEEKEPSLYSKASGIASGILSRLRKAFDIHSPSRKMKDIFKNVMLGAEEGIDGEKKSILNDIDDFSKNILSAFNNKMNGIGSNMSSKFSSSFNINQNKPITIYEHIETQTTIPVGDRVLAEVVNTYNKNRSVSI